MKNNSTSLKTMAIKSRVANFIRKALYKKRLEQFSDAEIQVLFSEIHALNFKAHTELNNYKQKRKKKAAVQREREKRGYVKKVKTPKPPLAS